MPFISDAQIARLQGSYASMASKMARAKAKAQEKVGQIKQVGEAVGAAGLMGFIRGKVEEPDGSFNIPGTSIDVELVTGLALVGTAMTDLFGRYGEDVLNAGIGVTSHYAGQVFRKWGKTGTFSMAAGVGRLPARSAYTGLPYSGMRGAAAVGQDALARALADVP